MNTLSDLYFSQINRVGPVKETNQLENRTDNPSGKTFAEMVVEAQAQLERERNSRVQTQTKEPEEKSESENKRVVDPISLSYNQMMLSSLIISSKKDEDKRRK